MDLKPCLDCGRLLSPDAVRCPGCKSPSPFGVKCRLCDETLPFNEAVCWSHGYVSGHLNCVVSILQLPDRCDVCDAALNALVVDDSRRVEEAYYRETCANCGQPNPRRGTGTCRRCSLPLFDDNYVVVDDLQPSKYKSRYHRTCAPAPASNKGCATRLVTGALLTIIAAVILESSR